MSCQGIQYRILDLSVPEELDKLEPFCAKIAENTSLRISLTPSVDFKGCCAQEYHFRIAESQFSRMSATNVKVATVEYLYNAILRERFLQKKAEFCTSKIPHEERFVVHNESADETDKITYSGFPAGSYVYTAFNPAPFVGRGGREGYKTAILCLALFGDSKDHELYTPFQLYTYENMPVTITNSAQLLPKYLVHYK